MVSDISYTPVIRRVKRRTDGRRLLEQMFKHSARRRSSTGGQGKDAKRFVPGDAALETTPIEDRLLEPETVPSPAGCRHRQQGGGSEAPTVRQGGRWWNQSHLDFGTPDDSRLQLRHDRVQTDLSVVHPLENVDSTPIETVTGDADVADGFDGPSSAHRADPVQAATVGSVAGEGAECPRERGRTRGDQGGAGEGQDTAGCRGYARRQSRGQGEPSFAGGAGGVGRGVARVRPDHLVRREAQVLRVRAPRASDVDSPDKRVRENSSRARGAGGSGLVSRLAASRVMPRRSRAFRRAEPGP